MSSGLRNHVMRSHQGPSGTDGWLEELCGSASPMSAVTIHAAAESRQPAAPGAAGRYRDARIEMRQRAIPVVGPGKVLVRIAQASVCGSDIHAVQTNAQGWSLTSCPAAGWERPGGLILGHEFSDVVVKVGVGVDRMWLGAPVTSDSVLSCGACATCEVDANHCPEARLLGLEIDGAFAEYVAVPASALHRIDTLYSKLGDEAFVVASIVEPLAVAAKAVDTATFHLRPGMPRSLLVLGAGGIGAGVASIARMKGFLVVIAEIDAERRQRAARFCDLAVDGEAPFVDSRVREALGEDGASVVVDACGAVEPRHLDLVRPVGVFLCLARTGSELSLPIDMCMSRGVTITCTRGHVGHLPAVIEWLSNGQLDASSFITRRLSGLQELVTWLQVPARFAGELKVVTEVASKEDRS